MTKKIKKIKKKKKKKLEMEKIKQKLIKQIFDKKNKLNEIKKEIELIEKNGNNNILKEEVDIFKKQQKKFDTIKNYLEEEYNKINKAYIQKERETEKEIHFNKKISELRNKSDLLKYDISSNKNQEIKKELGKYENEQILDRTPLLDEIL